MVEKFGPVFHHIFSLKEQMSLVQGAPMDVPELSVEQAFSHISSPKNETFARACLAGAYLYADHWDTAHRIAQELPTKEGSYWHAIIHRREPDYWNSKYWFRQVAHHPVFDELTARVQKLSKNPVFQQWGDQVLTEGRWDPFRFVDLCEDAVQQKGDLEAFCLAVQHQEFLLLFEYCYSRAVGKPGRR